MNILYLEDNKLDIELTRREFAKIAPELHLNVVSTVREAKEVLSQTGENGIDIILTDMHLPDGDGINFLEWVRENNLPYGVVMITGHGDEEIAVAALKSGADDCIAKTPGYLTRLPSILESTANRFTAEIGRKSKASLCCTWNTMLLILT